MANLVCTARPLLRAYAIFLTCSVLYGPPHKSLRIVGRARLFCQNFDWVWTSPTRWNQHAWWLLWSSGRIASCSVFFLRGPVGQLRARGPLIFTWTCCRGHLHDPTPGPAVRTPETTTAPCCVRDATSWLFSLVPNDRYDIISSPFPSQIQATSRAIGRQQRRWHKAAARSNLDGWLMVMDRSHAPSKPGDRSCFSSQ